MVADKFTAKQRLFVSEYIVSLNATDAARKAGYSEKNADKIGHELLGKTLVSEAIREALTAREQRTLVTADYVILGFKEIAERCMQRKPVMVFDKEKREYIQETALIENDDGTTTDEGVWQFDAGGANKAFEMLGKHLGLFNENKPININITPNIIDDIKK